MVHGTANSSSRERSGGEESFALPDNEGSNTEGRGAVVTGPHYKNIPIKN